ncbi:MULTISPECIES: glutathione S-transferase family protein [unclassified Luteibacter]|uniref:glutathione S-transferase family protein n=1 Tax=unclassified Luteibacter TaxID=2620188 RepID=UPI0008CB4DBB|nr:glutathione S-transferase family protein [Luteibacter sp. 3190]MDR6937423.1 glutathione S-transferase [Luteibacter sp. 3190]SEW24741.1 glutathione S-transferase [Luteibacter sp. 329MFSha]
MTSLFERFVDLYSPLRLRGLLMDGPIHIATTHVTTDKGTARMTPSRIVFHHAPNSRSGSTLMLLEELGAQYDMHVMDLTRGEQREPKFLKINPMGKVPAIEHLGGLVTERPAIFTYLADLHPEAGLAPGIGDPLRGPYLRWLSFYGSCFEPAVMDRFMKNAPAPVSTCPYGSFDMVLDQIEAQLAQGPWLFGERFTAADILWASSLDWTMKFGIVPRRDAFEAYVARLMVRPAIVRAAAQDAALARAQMLAAA